MSEKKNARRRNKERKMAAFIKLAEAREDDSSGSANAYSEHAQMIARLEQQMEETSAKVKRLCDDSGYGHRHGDSSNIQQSYRNLMSKRRKMSETVILPQFYIDQPFLSKCRHKNLLYDDHAPLLTTPIALQACQVQELIMYSMFGRTSLYRPRWCSIQHITGASQLLVLLLDGWSWLDVTLSQPSAFHETLSIFSDHAVRMVSPTYYGGKVEDDLFMVPLPAEEVANKLPKSDPIPSAKTSIPDDQLTVNTDKLFSADAFSRTMLLLPFSKLVDEGFPVPAQASGGGGADSQGFVFSKSSYGKVNSSSAIFAVDCEMVLTSDRRLSLASLCVVDESLKVVYKNLVKPDKPIIDYLTRYSGMTAKLMQDVTTTLDVVQRDLQNLLPADAILCGHSLNNDLAALQLYHPYVIDTSVSYNVKTHSKSSLKRLASQFLRKEIQNGSTGHCPEEDAVTAMMLVLLKLKIDYSFGNILTDGMMSTPDAYFCKIHQGMDSESCGQNTNADLPEHAVDDTADATTYDSTPDSTCDSTHVSASDTTNASDSTRVNNSDSTCGSTCHSSRVNTCHSTSGKCNSLQDDSGETVKKDLQLNNDMNLSKSSKLHSSETKDSSTEPQLLPVLDGYTSERRSSSEAQSTNITPKDVDKSEWEMIPTCNVFCRKHIPQLEVNMFDLVGHQDTKTAVICSNNMAMRGPQNDRSVSVYSYGKEKQVLRQAKRSIKDGADLVYCSLAAHQRNTPAKVKEHAVRTDALIAKLWKKLPIGGLFSLVLGGTKEQHGALMFAVKKHNSVMNTSPQPDTSDGDDTAVCSK